MNDAFRFIERARLLLQQGRVNDAVKEIKNALQLDPENDEALSIYARCLYDKSEFDVGIKVIKAAISSDPENSYYFYLLAFGYYRKDDNKTAIANLDKSIQLNPYFAESFGLYAHVLSEEKKFEAALAKANEGLAVSAENITCLNARSIALNKLRRTDDAIETMQNALSQDPDNEYTHSTIGWNHLERGQNKIAATHFREALRIAPNYHNARKGLKEALKSKIPPYKWLLQYSFWINNKGKKARWAIPVGLYVIIKIIASVAKYNQATEIIGGIIIGLYLIFVLTSWIINPLANFFLLFNKDGKYALDATEKYTAITVMGSLLLGAVIIITGLSFAKGNLLTSFIIAAMASCAIALPLGHIHYPLSFTRYGTQNKVSMVLAALGLFTLFTAFISTPVAIGAGTIFLVLFAINSWAGIFR